MKSYWTFSGHTVQYPFPGDHVQDVDLIAMMQDLESDLVERKAALTDRDKVQQAICAFANDLPRHEKPGVLFIGVTDDGKCADLTIPTTC